MSMYRTRKNPTPLKVKASKEEGVCAEVEGFGTTFEDPENYDSWGEIVDKGAIDLGELENLPMMNSHGAPIGVWREFSVEEAREGVEGLFMKGVIADTQEGQDVAKLIKLGTIKGLSIGFRVKKDGMEELLDQPTEWGYPVVKLNAIELKETSPTTFPANENAYILEVRSERLASHQSRNPISTPSIRTKAENLSTAINNAITAQADADEAMTEEQIIEALTTALDLSADAVAAVLSGQLLLSTMEQLEAAAEVLGVDVADLQAEAMKDAEVFMVDGEEDGDDETEDEGDELTEEEEEEFLAELAAMTDELALSA